MNDNFNVVVLYLYFLVLLKVFSFITHDFKFYANFVQNMVILEIKILWGRLNRTIVPLEATNSYLKHLG